MSAGSHTFTEHDGSRLPAADVEVEPDGQVFFVQCLPGMSECFSLDALVESMQVGALPGGDFENELGGRAIADDPAVGIVHTVVGTDLPSERIETEAFAHARQALDKEDLPISLDLDVSRRQT